MNMKVALPYIKDIGDWNVSLSVTADMPEYQIWSEKCNNSTNNKKNLRIILFIGEKILINGTFEDAINGRDAMKQGWL